MTTTWNLQTFSVYSFSWRYFSQPSQIEEKLKSRHVALLFFSKKKVTRSKLASRKQEKQLFVLVVLCFSFYVATNPSDEACKNASDAYRRIFPKVSQTSPNFSQRLPHTLPKPSPNPTKLKGNQIGPTNTTKLQTNRVLSMIGKLLGAILDAQGFPREAQEPRREVQDGSQTEKKSMSKNKSFSNSICSWT